MTWQGDRASRWAAFKLDDLVKEVDYLGGELWLLYFTCKGKDMIKSVKTNF